MTRLPLLKGKEIVRILEHAGFRGGSHSRQPCRSEAPDGRTTVVPQHASETIGSGLLRAILRDLEMSVDDFQKLC